MNARLVEPLEARSELRASAANWIKRDPLSGFEGFDLMNDRIEVEDIDALRTLAFEDRANLGFEEAQLPRVHRSGAIDCDRNLTSPFPHHSGQVESGPDMTPVGTHPAIVRRC